VSRRSRPGRLTRRALVHQPLQREGGEADHDQRAPAEVVVAEAVEHQAAHPGAEERPDLVTQEHDAVQRVEVRQSEHAPDDARDERYHAEPQEAHCRGEDERGRRLDRRHQERHDERRAEEVDQREQTPLAVARAENSEQVGADGVEETDHSERGRADAG